MEYKTKEDVWLEMFRDFIRIIKKLFSKKDNPNQKNEECKM